MRDWEIPDDAVEKLPRVALGKIASKDTTERVKLGWAKVLAQLDRNNIARSAVQARVSSIIDEDERNTERSAIQTAEELRRDPDFLAWYHERAVAADTGDARALSLSGCVAVGKTPGSD